MLVVALKFQYGPMTMIVAASGHQAHCIPWVLMGQFNEERETVFTEAGFIFVVNIIQFVRMFYCIFILFVTFVSHDNLFLGRLLPF